jgi:hypothetical protein
MTELLKENEDFVLVPAEGEDAWAVRFLKGDFVETVVQYGAVGFNEVKDALTFNFDIISTPNSELDENNEDLQVYAGQVLESIIIKGIDEGFVQLKDKE